MADFENTATNTAGEAGINTDTFDAETFADTILSAIEKKNAKNETSIINSNFERLSNEEKELAIAALNEKKERAARKEKEAFVKMQKERDDAIAKLQAYESQKNKENTTVEIKKILSAEGVSEDTNVSYALGLLSTSNFVKDGAVDTEAITNSVKKLVSDFPMLKTTKEVQKGAKQQSDKEKNEKAEMDLLRKAIGLK